MFSLELRGTFAQMGEQHGEAVKEALIELAEARTSLIFDKLGRLKAQMSHEDFERLTNQLADEIRLHLPQIGEEMDGVARGAGISPGKVLVAGGYTDVQDIVLNCRCHEVDGCTTLIVRGSPQKGAIIGGTWDTHGSAQESLAVVRRKPKNAPACIALTSVGWPAQQGVNEEGIIFATNNLVPTVARIGVVYIAIVGEISRTRSLSQIDKRIEGIKLASGHYYLMGDEKGNIIALETTANSGIVDIVGGRDVVFHTNHYLAPELMQVSTPPTSTSLHRLARIQSLIEELGTSEEAIWCAVSDHEGGEDCICRHGVGDKPRSCAAYIVDSDERRISFTIGPACSKDIEEIRL